MLTPTSFWRYTLSVGILVLALIGIVIWQSYPSSSNQNTSEVDQPLTAIDTAASPSVSNTAALTIDNSSPAPAKKLHQLMTNPGQPLSQDQLDAKIERVNQSITTLNQELEQRGITVPKNSVNNTAQSSNASDSDTRQRLQAIQNHLTSQNQH